MEHMMMLMLVVAVVLYAVRYHRLKKQLKTILRQLQDEQMKLVSIELIDDDLEIIVLEINGLLEKIQQTIIKSNQSAAALKSSITDISHDMKTPLTSVIGYLQLLERECRDETMQEAINICLERTRYCNTLINDFFEYSMLESQGCVPNLEHIDVAGMICEQLLAHDPIFREKKIIPHFEESDQTVMVMADAHLLQRVIQNLISNCIKYTSGDMYFHTSLAHGQVTIIVSNPINADLDVTQMFDRFYTQDQARNQGSGIGLYICKQFVEAMGGSICAEVNKGCLSIKVTLHTI